MHFFKTALVAGAGLLGTAAWAQGGLSASSAAQKVGVIDVRRAMQSTAEGKQVSAELSAKYQPRQTELENLSRQLNDLQQRVTAGQDKLSDEEMNRLRREGQRINTQLERKRNEYQEDLNNEQADILDRLGHKLMDVVDRYARESGYSVVLDVSAQNTPVVYSSSQVDITQDIIRLYDETYPVKAAAAAPAQPRPAQPHQAPPQQKPQ
jgi:outer membrane protein